jgi:hypothetical protein
MKLHWILSVLIILGLCSCKKENIDGRIKKSRVLAQELRSSPEIQVIAGKALILKTNVWRDFMPIAEENGSPMICLNYLIVADSTVIPNSIILKKQHIVMGNEIWSADYLEFSTPKIFMLEGIVRNGPKWGPHIKVDIICEFEYQGKIFKILAKDQNIEKTI